jgi:DNA-directed RNA polymerase subunit alpha
MWYELKEKYMPERARRNRSLHGEDVASDLPVELPEEEEQQQSPLLKAGIDELGLSTRSENCLRCAGIETIGQLADKTERELRMIRNFGQKCLAEVTAKMAEKNLFIRKEENGEQT